MWSVNWGDMVLCSGMWTPVDWISSEAYSLCVRSIAEPLSYMLAVIRYWLLLNSCVLKWWLCCSWFCFLGVSGLSWVAHWNPANWWGQARKAYPDRATWPVLSLQACKYTSAQAYLYMHMYIFCVYNVCMAVCIPYLLCIYTMSCAYGNGKFMYRHLYV